MAIYIYIFLCQEKKKEEKKSLSSLYYKRSMASKCCNATNCTSGSFDSNKKIQPQSQKQIFDMKQLIILSQASVCFFHKKTLDAFCLIPQCSEKLQAKYMTRVGYQFVSRLNLCNAITEPWGSFRGRSPPETMFCLYRLTSGTPLVQIHLESPATLEESLRRIPPFQSSCSLCVIRPELWARVCSFPFNTPHLNGHPSHAQEPGSEQ